MTVYFTIVDYAEITVCLAELWSERGNAEKAMENLLSAEKAATNYDLLIK